MLKPIIATVSVVIGLYNPAVATESLRASEFTLICNDNPASSVFAVLKSKAGGFLGFSKDGTISFTSSKSELPQIMGTWERMGATPHVAIITKEGVRTNLVGLYAKKCDLKFTF